MKVTLTFFLGEDWATPEEFAAMSDDDIRDLVLGVHYA